MSPEEIRSLDFFWSVRRRRYWNQCRRRYFLHYYMARIGRREDADFTCKQIFDLDRRISAQAFVRVMICRSLHTRFRRGEKGRLVDAALSSLRWEVNKMLSRSDSQPLIVSELLDPEIPVKQTIDCLNREIRQAAEKVEANFWSKIKDLPREMRRIVFLPQRVYFMDLTCYFVPVTAFVTHGELWILEGCGVKDAGDLISCLHRMYACNELGHDPTRVRSLYLDENYELKQLDDLFSVSAFLEEIRQDLREMKEAEMEGVVTLRDFPAQPGEVCASCQFLEFCVKQGTFSQQS